MNKPTSATVPPLYIRIASARADTYRALVDLTRRMRREYAPTAMTPVLPAMRGLVEATSAAGQRTAPAVTSSAYIRLLTHIRQRTEN